MNVLLRMTEVQRTLVGPRQWPIIPESWGFNRAKENGRVSNGHREGVETKMMEEAKAGIFVQLNCLFLQMA